MTDQRREMKRLFWKLYLQPPRWCDGRWLAWHYERDQIRGIAYAGVTIAGWSLLYSDHWGSR
jgi:hypothetical protein